MIILIVRKCILCGAGGKVKVQNVFVSVSFSTRSLKSQTSLYRSTLFSNLKLVFRITFTCFCIFSSVELPPPPPTSSPVSLSQAIRPSS